MDWLLIRFVTLDVSYVMAFNAHIFWYNSDDI